MPSPAPSIGATPRRVHAPMLLGAIALAALLMPSAARAADPLAVMRAYCQADGHGARLAARTWESVAPLVAWTLEPAWDRLRLIRGYEVGTPRLRDGLVDIDVQYTLFADVSAEGVKRSDRIETRRYTLEPDGAQGWRLRGPPPPPYVFENQADGDALVALLSPDDSDYASNSAFVFRLLRDAGWEIPYADTSELPTAFGYRGERTANVGDVVLYYDGGEPYHVAIVEADDAVVSATLNGGIRRTSFGAFPGEIRYLRPNPALAVPPTPAPTP